jgi:hypothetical protein
VVSPKGRWLSRSPGGHGVNWTTSDTLGDMGGQSTFHSNLVDVTVALEPDLTRDQTAASGPGWGSSSLRKRAE